MSETTIINGQPQGLGNRMVTYDGLVDFLEMLKHEIPKMGLDNYIRTPNANNYLFGSNNKSYGSIQFAVGDNNHLEENTGAFALGADNTVNGGQYCFAFGYNNTIQKGQYCLALGEGHDFSNFKNSFILGSDHALKTNAGPIQLDDYDPCMQVAILGKGLQIYQFDDAATKIDYSVLPPTCLLGMYNKPYTIQTGLLGGEKGKDESFRLFEIGNGSDNGTRSTCFYVEQSGKTFISKLAVSSPQSITLTHYGGGGYSEPSAEITPGLYWATMGSQYTLLYLQAINTTITTSLQNLEKTNLNIEVKIEGADTSKEITITVYNMQLESSNANLHLTPMILFEEETQ